MYAYDFLEIRCIHMQAFSYDQTRLPFWERDQMIDQYTLLTLSDMRSRECTEAPVPGTPSSDTHQRSGTRNHRFNLGLPSDEQRGSSSGKGHVWAH
jgi:hypothetical protein